MVGKINAITNDFKEERKNHSTYLDVDVLSFLAIVSATIVMLTICTM